MYMPENNTKYGSTISIGLFYYADDQRFQVTGRVISKTEIEPNITTNNIEQAFTILEQRVQEIPSNLNDMFSQDS